MAIDLKELQKQLQIGSLIEFNRGGEFYHTLVVAYNDHHAYSASLAEGIPLLSITEIRPPHSIANCIEQAINCNNDYPEFIELVKAIEARVSNLGKNPRNFELSYVAWIGYPSDLFSMACKYFKTLEPDADGFLVRKKPKAAEPNPESEPMEAGTGSYSQLYSSLKMEDPELLERQLSASWNTRTVNELRALRNLGPVEGPGPGLIPPPFTKVYSCSWISEKPAIFQGWKIRMPDDVDGVIIKTAVKTWAISATNPDDWHPSLEAIIAHEQARLAERITEAFKAAEGGAE